MMSRMRQGIQPGLAPVPPNMGGNTPIGPSPEMAQQLGNPTGMGVEEGNSIGNAPDIPGMGNLSPISGRPGNPRDPSQPFMPRIVQGDPMKEAIGKMRPNGMGVEEGASISPFFYSHTRGPSLSPAPPMNPSLSMRPKSSMDNRIAPMRSGTLTSRGRHPIGTNPQRMLRYNSGMR